MCGIIGLINFEDSSKDIRKAAQKIIYRGKDAQRVVEEKNMSFFHCLHAMHGFVEQPFEDSQSIFLINCEIYNHEELSSGKNDAQVLFNYFKEKEISDESLSKIRGVYAFAKYHKKNKDLILTRDLLGVKPLWYYFDKERFAFASERKALVALDVDKTNIQELNPRKILRYNIEKKEISFEDRKFFELKKANEPYKKITETTKSLLDAAIVKRVDKNHKIGILFSGGVDSAYIALILKQNKIPFTCYVAGLEEEGLKGSEDVLMAQKAAKKHGFNLKKILISLDEVPRYLKIILPLIEDNNVVKAGVALPFFLCAEQARKDGVKLMFSGLGSEEIFAGYERHKKAQDINKECLFGLRKIYERDLYRDDVITMNHNIEIRLPFLDYDLVKYALTIPSKHKIKEGHTKYVLRDIAFRTGLDEEFAFRPKKAAQYGSNFDKAIQKLAKKEKNTKSQYLKQFHDEGNVRLGILMSTGKDSLLATQIMKEQNYEVKCFITLISENKDSYMYHGPNTHLAKLQSETSRIPLIIQETLGEKEKELEDLKTAIQKAIQKYSIEGIVTGALYSDYQRKRIEKICDELGIKCFSPLWHMDQEEELKLLLKKEFKFCMVKVAAEGLDESWLGKTITEKEIEKLSELNKKIGFNVAGEGGEYESFVLKAPFFQKEIMIEKSKVIKEGGLSSTLIIQKARTK